MKILAINPGATSTKLAAFDDDRELFRDSLDYPSGHFGSFQTVFEQFAERAADIERLLQERHLDYRFDAVVGRGGLIGPVRPGAYLVDDAFEDVVRNRPTLDHASNLGGPLARAVAAKFGVPGCPALIYDPVTVDEMDDVARLTGIAGIERKSIGHHLNMRAVAIDLADKLGKGYAESDLIVVHLGGGSSASAHRHGTVVDFISDDEVQFSAERSGGIPLKEIVGMLKRMTVAEFNHTIRAEAGLKSHVGTTDMRVLEQQIDAGDAHAVLVLDALALQVAKAIGCLAVSMYGHVDGIILTGGMAYSKLLCEKVAERTAFIAPLHPYPGEAEMEALAGGARRVLLGLERVHQMSEPTH